MAPFSYGLDEISCGLCKVFCYDECELLTLSEKLPQMAPTCVLLQSSTRKESAASRSSRAEGQMGRDICSWLKGPSPHQSSYPFTQPNTCSWPFQLFPGTCFQNLKHRSMRSHPVRVDFVFINSWSKI